MDDMNEAKYCAADLEVKLARWEKEASHYKAYALSRNLIVERDELQQRLDALLGMLAPKKLPVNNYYCCCPACGWHGGSESTEGGGPIGDTGDYGDILCPQCLEPISDSDEMVQFLVCINRQALRIASGLSWPVVDCQSCGVQIDELDKFCISGPLCSVCLDSQMAWCEEQGKRIDAQVETQAEMSASCDGD